MTTTNQILGEPEIYNTLDEEHFAEGCDRVGIDAENYHNSNTSELLVYPCGLFIELLHDDNYFCLVYNEDIVGTREQCEAFLIEKMAGEGIFDEVSE